MKRLIAFLCLLSPVLYAEDLQFNDAISVTLNKPGVFHHLDASGRKNIAVNNTHVAVVWEDNRNGKPQVYTTIKALISSRFPKAIQLSNESHDAYEPTLLVIDNNAFLYAWEQNQHIWLTTVKNNKAAPPVQLDQQRSSQVSLTRTTNGKIYAAWIQHVNRQQQLVISELKIDKQQINILPARIVDTYHSPRRQSHPSLVAIKNGLVIGWEDRQHGHTRIYTSYSVDGKSFAKKQVLNDFIPPQNSEFGRGTGATRVALASDGNNKVTAVWMDKRNFLGGYDVYAAISTDAGKHFGPDEKAQDMLGENQPQWHPAIAMTSTGKILVAWDDPRDDSPDIWYAQRTADGWSDDETIPAASGEGAQTSPSIAYDAQGRIHLIWLQKMNQGTKLRYCHSQ